MTNYVVRHTKILPPFKSRKVLLLDQGRVWKNGKYGEPYTGQGPHSTPGFWQWLYSIGYVPEDVAGYGIHPDIGVATKKSRNLPWKSLPVVVKPLFEYAAEGRCVYARGRASDVRNQVLDQDGFSVQISYADADSRTFLSKDVIATAEIVILDLRTPSDSEIRKHTCAFDHLDEAALPSFYIAKEGSLSGLSSGEVMRLREKFEAQERFQASHDQNASIFLGRALHHLPSAERIDSAVAVNRSRFSVFGDPLALQILFEAAAKGVSDVEQWRNSAPPQTRAFWDNWTQMRESLIHASGHVEGLTADGNPRFVWRGSGKYRPLVIEDGYELHQLNSLYYDLGNLRLLSFKVDGTVAITELGLKLTQFLGRSGNDPDVLLRWRTEDGTNGTQSDIPAMDRWLNKFLRETKRKVADLKPFAFTEAGGSGGPPRSWNRYAYGSYLDFGDLDLDEDERVKLVQCLDEADVRAADQPWWTLNHGPVRSYSGTGSMNRIGIWYGCPLGVGPGWAKDEPPALPDMETKASAAFHALPNWMKRLFPSDRQVISVGSTHERNFHLNEAQNDDPAPKSRVSGEGSRSLEQALMDMSSSPVVRGWRIPIDDLSDFDPTAIKLIGQMRSQRTTPRDPRYFSFTLAKSRDKTYAVVGCILWSPGWSRSSYGLSSLSYFTGPLIQHIKEHYGPLIGHRLADGIKTWHVDERTLEVMDIDFDDDRIEEIDELFVSPLSVGPNRPSF
ncbi:hypothetical protein [Rhizobium sp. BK176]|uniref:hypothetical protein n=1 Tax=Rhizobium sp. BK176 TaxID=2587071 RepID=UPI002167E4CB|nr:hypothetical protein [Rhizobium sp. BK176]MCS4089941.1 hypothetical protein [Rhizobium sp. BK176]